MQQYELCRVIKDFGVLLNRHVFIALYVYSGFGNDRMNMLAQQIRNGPYIEPQNFNAWNRNVGELIEYNNTKNANVNYVQDDMNPFGNDFANSRNYNYTNNFNGEMSSSDNTVRFKFFFLYIIYFYYFHAFRLTILESSNAGSSLF